MDQTLTAENRKKGSGLGLGMQNTCANIQGIYQKRRGLLDFCAQELVRMLVASNYLVLVKDPVFSPDSA